MRMLAGHVLPGDLSVEMAINGFPIGSNYHRFVVYTRRDDALVDSLTVYQAVLFEAALSVDVESVAEDHDLSLRVRSILKLLEMDAIADQRLRKITEPGQVREVQLALALAATLATALTFGMLILRLPPPDGHAYAATLLILGAYVMLHAVLAGLMQAFLIVRARRGFISSRRRAELPIVLLWSDYLAAVAVLSLLAAHLPGFLV